MTFTQNDSTEYENYEETILKEDLQKLGQIDQYAIKVISLEKDTTRQIELLKLWTQRDLHFSISSNFAWKIICKAAGQKLGIPEPVSSDVEIDITEDSMVWGEILMYQSWNLISALPKVGKSALVIGIAGAVLNNKSTFLNLPIHYKFDNLIIVGNDQSYKQWGKLFLREKLCTKNNNKITIDPRIALWAQGSGIQLDEEGIARIVEECKRRPNCLLLIDTLRSVTSQMGLDENKTEISAPIRRIQDATAELNVTGIILHHTTKSVYGGNAVIASSGSAAIPAAFDQTILMNWLKAVTDQSTQTDKRIAISCMGRGVSSTIVAELADNKWISHGDGEEAIRAEKISELEDNLQGRQGDVYDRLIQSWETSTKMSTIDIANALNLTANKALRTLKALERKGLIVQDGVAPRTNEKGRPIALFRPTKGDIDTGCFNDFNDFNDNKTIKIHKTPTFPPPLREEVPINLEVQRKVDNGDWQNGWVISDTTDLHSITISRMGSPHICINDCKWMIDLRPCKNN